MSNLVFIYDELSNQDYMVNPAHVVAIDATFSTIPNSVGRFIQLSNRETLFVSASNDDMIDKLKSKI